MHREGSFGAPVTHSSCFPAGTPEGYQQKEASDLFHHLSREKWKPSYWVKQCLYSWSATATAFTAEQHSFIVTPRALGLWAPEMHKPHLNSAFVHDLPPWDLHPFLDSCVPLPFQQGAIKTILPDLKERGHLLFSRKKKTKHVMMPHK